MVSNIDNFSDILPKGTLVYIAYIEGTPIEDMVDTPMKLKEMALFQCHTFQQE